jgi:hypothetical protein
MRILIQNYNNILYNKILIDLHDLWLSQNQHFFIFLDWYKIWKINDI